MKFESIPRERWMQDLSWVDQLKSPQFDWSVVQMLQLSFDVECLGVVIRDEANTGSFRVPAFVVFQNCGDHGEILLLATQPQSVRQGLMKKLLTQLINAPYNATQQIHEWWLEVHDKNESARHLYAQLGFQVTGERKRYYKDGASALMLSRKRAKS